MWCQYISTLYIKKKTSSPENQFSPPGWRPRSFACTKPVTAESLVPVTHKGPNNHFCVSGDSLKVIPFSAPEGGCLRRGSEKHKGCDPAFLRCLPSGLFRWGLGWSRLCVPRRRPCLLNATYREMGVASKVAGRCVCPGCRTLGVAPRWCEDPNPYCFLPSAPGCIWGY